MLRNGAPRTMTSRGGASPAATSARCVRVTPSAALEVGARVLDLAPHGAQLARAGARASPSRRAQPPHGGGERDGESAKSDRITGAIHIAVDTPGTPW